MYLCSKKSVNTKDEKPNFWTVSFSTFRANMKFLYVSFQIIQQQNLKYSKYSCVYKTFLFDK